MSKSDAWVIKLYSAWVPMLMLLGVFSTLSLERSGCIVALVHRLDAQTSNKTAGYEVCVWERARAACTSVVGTRFDILLALGTAAHEGSERFQAAHGRCTEGSYEFLHAVVAAQHGARGG